MNTRSDFPVAVMVWFSLTRVQVVMLPLLASKAGNKISTLSLTIPLDQGSFLFADEGLPPLLPELLGGLLSLSTFRRGKRAS